MKETQAVFLLGTKLLLVKEHGILRVQIYLKHFHFNQYIADSGGGNIKIGGFENDVQIGSWVDFTTNLSPWCFTLNRENGITSDFDNIDEVRILPQSGAMSISINNVEIGEPLTIPDAPTVISGTVANAQSSVSFTAPVSNGGSIITGYTVNVYQGGVLQAGLSVSGASSPIIVSGLTNGTTYTFKVLATNAVGDSTESTVSDLVTPREPSTNVDSSGSNNNPTPNPTPETITTSVDVLFNGKLENAGTSTTTKKDE